ncbi:MAG: universal stress protein, partial [bacterium]
MKILLATDGSESSEEAARFLTHLALTPQDQIIVLHVLSQIPYDDDYHARIKRVIRAVAPRVVRSTMQILQPVKANLRAIAIEGYPDTTIVETAVEEDADLIAMGARGVRGLKVLVLGSATRAVAINSPKHTLVVKKPLPGQGIRKVLFAYDGSNCAFLTGTFLAKIPFPEDTEAAVLHVTQTAVSDIPHQFIEKDESETIREIPE